MISAVERVVFRHRGAILGLLGLFTLVMGHYACLLRMDAGFAKQLPRGHEYVETFFEYQDQLFGADRIVIVLRARSGDVWRADFLSRLARLTDSVFFLPGIDRRTVTSLWTPNARYLEITEDGIRSEDVIGGDVTPQSLTAEDIEAIRGRVIHGGHLGHLVARDQGAAMITADILERDPGDGSRLDYLGLARDLETKIRNRFRDAHYDVHILGFAKQMGDIAEGVLSAFWFFALAFLLTTAAVYVYCRSWLLTPLVVLCSLTSVIWQFAAIYLLGFGLDPLAILVPFLVFAIGVSHGVQQVNLITRQISLGRTAEQAARASFRDLLVPGSMALLTDLIGFGTLVLIPIPMIQELGITATIGVAFKIVSNLLMLPLLASCLPLDSRATPRPSDVGGHHSRPLLALARIASRRNAVWTLIVLCLLFVTALWQARGRHVGDLCAGVPELAVDSRYNRDARFVSRHFDLGLDLLTLIVETPEGACIDYPVMDHLDRLGWALRNTPGVLSVFSAPEFAKQITAAWNEGNPKWAALPRNRYALVQATSPIPASSGLLNANCTLLPLQVFTADHRARTIKHVVAEVERFREAHRQPGVRIRLGSGNIGLQAAINEVLEASELPMLAYVYLTIVALVILTYRDWRATLCCCLPLTLATALGYAFMKQLEIGLKVATLPVMVLAVGIGVDYAFYIYNRLQRHLANGLDITLSYRAALLETGGAVVFTALTLAIGVATWTLSPLKFQADMGLLLAFMFVTNMLMGVTGLPALAVVLEMLVPRRRGRGESR